MADRIYSYPTDLYKGLACLDEQEARILVQVGCFGILQDDSDEVVHTFDEDSVVSCSVKGTTGDGAYAVGVADSWECTLDVFTEDAKAAGEYLTTHDYRVCYGYVDPLTGDVEYLVMGIFATDPSMVTRSGLTTTITLCDFMYWLDSQKCGLFSYERGREVSPAYLAGDFLEKFGLGKSKGYHEIVHDLFSLKYYRPRSGSYRTHIADVAACVGRNVDVHNMFLNLIKPGVPPDGEYEGKYKVEPDTTVLTAYPANVHQPFAEVPDGSAADGVLDLSAASFGDIGPDDFTGVPSYDLTESTAASMTCTVSGVNDYESESASSLKEPGVKLVKCTNDLVSAFGVSEKHRKSKKDYYVVYIYKPAEVSDRNICGIPDTDDPASLKYATVQATHGDMAGKTLLQIYNAGRLLGTYVTRNVTAIGKRVFDLNRYGSKFHLNGSDTKWFPAYSEGGSSYSGTFGSADKESSRNLHGPCFSNPNNRQTDWESVSSWRNTDVDYKMTATGGNTELSWDSSTTVSSVDGTTFELDAETFANGGQVNVLKDTATLDGIASDFSAISKRLNLPFSYVASSTVLHGRNFYVPGDVLNVTDAYGDTYKACAFEVTYDYCGGIATTIACSALDGDSSSVADYSAVEPSTVTAAVEKEEDSRAEGTGSSWNFKVVASRPSTCESNTVYFVTG